MTPRESAGYLPWWLLLGVAAACLLASVALAGFVALTRTVDLPQPTATFQVVTAPPAGLPTATQPPAVPTADTPPTATAPPPPAGEVRVGSYVQVTGTGDAGFLNLRSEASLTAAVNYLALEREVFQVQAGPASADGFTWWYLVDPANPASGTRFGWAVQNYLQAVSGP